MWVEKCLCTDIGKYSVACLFLCSCVGLRHFPLNVVLASIHTRSSEGNPFPTSHFTNAYEFDTPTAPTSWSTPYFATRIKTETDNAGIDGCGIIAHSQGGLASLHLYAKKWSCLDYSLVSGRMIQSVGSPYQGTPLAGNLAALGKVFDVGCGYNDSLTISGADTWLATIPNWARAQVTYHTTSFEDGFWYDYCHLGTDAILNDPDDGIVEYARAQLPGGNNAGHKEGWCHNDGMRDPKQTNDPARNSIMNSYAQY